MQDEYSDEQKRRIDEILARPFARELERQRIQGLAHICRRDGATAWVVDAREQFMLRWVDETLDRIAAYDRDAVAEYVAVVAKLRTKGLMWEEN